MAYGIAGILEGRVTIEIIEQPTEEINPHVSISPATGIAGTPFEAEWTGLSPNHGLTQHLRPKGESELPVVIVTTDSEGRATTLIDSQDLYPETYELWGIDNGSSASSNMVEFDVTGDTDLSPYIIDFSPHSIRSGEKLSVTFAVKNSGAASSGPFSAWVYASTSTYGTQNILCKVPFESVEAGTSGIVTVCIPLPPSLGTGEYYLTVYADAPGNGVVEESREDNNIGSSSPNRLSVESNNQNVTLTLYVHENSADGPMIVGALVTGDDGAGNGFSQTTNSAGYVTITGVPGTWRFTASKTGYHTKSWLQSTTTTETRDACLMKQVPNVTLTLYVHENSADGPMIVGALVTGDDGAGNGFSQTTNSAGYVTITGVPGTWSFTASKTGYHTKSWLQSTTITETRDAYLMKEVISVTLGEALDNTDLTFTTGGDANWFGQTAVSFYDGDAAQSGAIGDGDMTYLRTTVTGPGYITFYWKVSSHPSGDYFQVYVDGLPWLGASGSLDWDWSEVYIQGSGTHTVEWRYSKDGSGSSGSDCCWVDKVEFHTTNPPSPLQEALDNTDLIFDTGGGANWFGQTAVSFYDGDAAQSGAIGDGDMTYLRTMVTGPGYLTFYWKLSSQAPGDTFQVYVDGLPCLGASGSLDWDWTELYISSGTYFVQWTYSKDGSGSSGSDCCWVDKVEFTPSS